MKYRPQWPSSGFESLEQARAWVEQFVQWYISEHRHSKLNFVTTAESHAGKDRQVLDNRREVLEAARQANPQRWSKSIRNCQPAGAVELNPEKKKGADKRQPERRVSDNHVDKHRTAFLIYQMALVRGYPGGLSQFRQWMAQLRTKPQPEAYLRLRTLPGGEGQIDWGLCRPCHFLFKAEPLVSSGQSGITFLSALASLLYTLPNKKPDWNFSYGPYTDLGR